MFSIKVVSFSILLSVASHSLSDPVDQLLAFLTEYQLEAAWPWASIQKRLYLATTSGLLIANDQQVQKIYPGTDFFPVVTDKNNLYLTNRQGELWQSPLQSPEKVNWRRSFQSWAFPPIIKNNQIYLTTRFEGLMAIDAATGKIEWTAKLSHEPVYRPVFLPDNQIGVLTYGARLMIYSYQGKLLEDIKLPGIGKYLTLYEEPHPSQIKRLQIVGIDGSLIQVDWHTRTLTQQQVAKRILTPVYADKDFWWLLEDKSRLWQLNLGTGVLMDNEIKQHYIEHIYSDNKDWFSIIKNNGTFSRQRLSIKPAPSL